MFVKFRKKSPGTTARTYIHLTRIRMFITKFIEHTFVCTFNRSLNDRFNRSYVACYRRMTRSSQWFEAQSPIDTLH